MNTQQKTGQSVKPTREELLNIWNYSMIEGAQDYLNPIAKNLEQAGRTSGLLWACFMAFKIGEVAGKRAERARRHD